MLSYNSNHIFISYLKELLASYNLPKYHVYTTEDAHWAKANSEEGPNIIDSRPANTALKSTEGHQGFWDAYYLRGNCIQKYLIQKSTANDSFMRTWETVPSDSFFVGKHDLNMTKRLLLKTTEYNAYTHKYLGDFLRFKRDYNDIDLMPLYNCFTDELIQNADIIVTKTTWDQNDIKTTQSVAEFNSSDPNFKIYYIPVKLFKNYTIAIDSAAGIEVCCCLYDGEYVRYGSAASTIIEHTYRRYPRTFFNQPIVYKALTEIITPDKAHSHQESLITETFGGREEMNKILYDLEEYSISQNNVNLMSELNNLTLLLKVPYGVKSTITILEGDYSGYNQFQYDKLKQSGDDTNMVLTLKENHWVTNFKPCIASTVPGQQAIPIKLEDTPFKPITHLQLLEFNTGKSHPFSDRLIEYLLENTISSENPELTDNVKRIQKVLISQDTGYKPFADGVWEEEIRRRLYDYMYSKKAVSTIASVRRRDCLGYCDKDIENQLVAKDALGNIIIALNNVDIYEDGK